MSLICGESNGVREESTACGPAERKKRTPRARPGGVRASRRRALRVAARSAPRRPVWNSHFGRPLEVAKPNSLFDFHTVADGAAPCDHRSGIVPGRGRFATSRLDPRVPGRGAPRDRSFHPRFCRKHGLHLCGNQPVCRVHRQFFTNSFLGDAAAVLARSSGEEPAQSRHRAGVASMAWRTTR